MKFTHLALVLVAASMLGCGGGPASSFYEGPAFSWGDPGAVNSFVEEHDLRWRHAVLEPADAARLGEEYELLGCPAFWLLDPEGRVLFRSGKAGAAIERARRELRLWR